MTMRPVVAVPFGPMQTVTVLLVLASVALHATPAAVAGARAGTFLGT
jgi:hypothetical protein